VHETGLPRETAANHDPCRRKVEGLVACCTGRDASHDLPHAGAVDAV